MREEGHGALRGALKQSLLGKGRGQASWSGTDRLRVRGVGFGSCRWAVRKRQKETKPLTSSLLHSVLNQLPPRLPWREVPWAEPPSGKSPVYV